MKSIKIIFIVGQVFFLLLFNFHALHSKGGANQTSINMLFYGLTFLIFGLAILLITKFKPKLIGKMDNLVLVIFALSIITSLNFYLFDYFNIMVEYERWLKKGMPQKPFCF
ncbi:MAG: hypothetical protein KA319_07005 [Ferruginibacter sp.]|nr:hypothetical protein [Ferruginibacter sp.]